MGKSNGLPSGTSLFVEENGYYWKGISTALVPDKTVNGSKPLVVDLFCGMGGLSLGFEMAGYETALGLDIHKPSILTFKKSHPTAATILGDIRKVLFLDKENRKENLLTETVKKVVGSKEVDVLMAGIPCQGFSLANRKRNVLDERNYLFLYFIEAVKLIKPKYVVIENVTGLKSFNGGSFVENIEKTLEETGYKTKHYVLNALDYGVPQSRKRVVFIGSRSDYPAIENVPPEFGVGKKPPRTVRDAIFDLPRISSGGAASAYSNVNFESLSEYQKLMKGDCSKLLNHVAPKHPKEVIQNISSTKPGEPMYEKYKQRIRLSWDTQSPTQVSGGIRPQFQFGHPEIPRGLTVRERCRIQSIPDWVEVFGGVVQGRVQTGNAVPPLLAKAIATQILKGLQLKWVTASGKTI